MMEEMDAMDAKRAAGSEAPWTTDVILHCATMDHRLLLRGSSERCRWHVLRFRRVLGQHLQHHLAQLSWLVLELERG